MQEFLEGVKQDRFKIPDFEQAKPLFEVWEKQEKERKEKKRQRNAERDEEFMQKYGVVSKGKKVKENNADEKEREVENKVEASK